MRNFTSINNFSIRRSLFAAAFAGAACLAPAQSMQLLETITDANDSTLNTMALAISPNHRYLAGSAMNYDTGMMGVFIYDTETETATYVPQDGFMSNRIVAVNDEGFACGNNDYPMTVGPDGVMTKLPQPDEYSSTVNDMTADGMDVEGDDADPYSVLDDLDGMEGDGEHLEEGEEESDVLDEGVSEEGEPMQGEFPDESADVTEETEDGESDVLDEGTSEGQSDDDGEPDNVVYAEGDTDSDVTDEGVVVEQSEEESDVADEGVEDKTDEEVEEDNEEESDEEESEKDKTEKFSKSRNLPSTRTIKSLATPVRKSIVGTVDKPPFTVAVGQSRGMHDEVMKAIQEVYDSEPQDIDMNTDPHEYVKKDREMLELMKKGNLFEL